MRYLYMLHEKAICWACHRNKQDNTLKPVAFWNDETEHGFCLEHVEEAREVLKKWIENNFSLTEETQRETHGLSQTR